MKKTILIILLLAVLLSACGESCVTGKVLNKSESGGKYYVEIAVEENFVFTGEVLTKSVDKDFYIAVNVNHLVTVCD